MSEKVEQIDSIEETTKPVETEKPETKSVKADKVEEPKKSFVQHRVERAERQTEEKILEQLGAESIEELKERLNQVEDSQRKLEELQEQQVAQEKRTKLISELSKEKAFDPELLTYMVDLDKVENSSESVAQVVQELKELKPNHFGVETLSGDNVVKGNNTKLDPIAEKEKQGDYQGAIAEWLKNI